MRRARPGQRTAARMQQQLDAVAEEIAHENPAGGADVPRDGARRVVTQDEIAERLGLTVEHLDQLDMIAAGRPPRNAKTVLDAIRLRLEWAYSKPPQRHEVDVISDRLERGIARLRAAGVPVEVCNEPNDSSA